MTIQEWAPAARADLTKIAKAAATSVRAGAVATFVLTEIGVKAGSATHFAAMVVLGAAVGLFLSHRN